MSSADHTAAEKAAGQLQQNKAELHGSDGLKQAAHTNIQQAKGREDADKGTGQCGFAPVAGAKDHVKDQLSDRKEV
ncbi:uncharacterized protein UTRI_00757 [Ustilago trichophora]|uniref:Uncharacterized protein n=1 Tax=Ustilago trichophora TaxID=86804 RepID=A0A5C3DUQ4_9BASI|nr:uncharacterized protein UTRI_00757 [Ustilago trichophora]